MPAAKDGSELRLLATRVRQAAPATTKECANIVKQTSEELNGAIKQRMPVASGRAKAGWGKYTPQHLVMMNSKSGPADAIWLVSNKGLSIRQGTNVPYTWRLNSGHSQQAPAGFVDSAFEFAKEDFEHRVRRLKALKKALAK